MKTSLCSTLFSFHVLPPSLSCQNSLSIHRMAAMYSVCKSAAYCGSCFIWAAHFSSWLAICHFTLHKWLHNLSLCAAWPTHSFSALSKWWPVPSAPASYNLPWSTFPIFFPDGPSSSSLSEGRQNAHVLFLCSSKTNTLNASSVED